MNAVSRDSQRVYLCTLASSSHTVMYNLRLFYTAAFLALLAVVCSRPAAQSVQEYDEQQERLHKMLDKYKVRNGLHAKTKFHPP